MKVSLTISSPGSNLPRFFYGDYAEQIHQASAIGFDAVELHIRDPKTVDHRSIYRSLEKTGIEVSTIGTGRAYGEDKIFLPPQIDRSGGCSATNKDQVILPWLGQKSSLA
jgi:hypothetical protein